MGENWFRRCVALYRNRQKTRALRRVIVFAIGLCGSSTCLAFLLASVAGLGEPISAEKISAKVADIPLASKEVAKYFPFHIGSSWTYSFKQSTEEGSGSQMRTRKVTGHYSETVVSLDQSFGNSVQLAGVKRDGDPPSYASCPVEKDLRSPDHTKPDFWYVTDRYRVFIVCTQQDAGKLVSTLGNSPSGKISNFGPDYVLPFKSGETWGADPDTAPRDDNFYEWAVEGQGDITVPAGKYKGCYSIIFRTLPDHEIKDICPGVGLVATRSLGEYAIKDICPGVGLVADEYEHHGTLDEHRVELTHYSSGAVRKAQ